MKNESIKPGWRRVKFGDVVRLSKARSQNPLTDGFDRYVGLEHLAPGDLRIRSWGSVADGVTFTSVFQPGQVLFGKRRAYQRKVAVADFAGVCSGDIYVLETKDALVLLPALLPFICQTDAFFDHAVGTSAGSLSPRTNWTSLADFEFALPPIAEQIELMERLMAIQSAIEKQQTLIGMSKKMSLAIQVDFFTSLWRSVEAGGTRVVKLKDLLREPLSNGIFRRREEFGSGTRLLNVTDIYEAFRVNHEKLERVEATEKEIQNFSALPGDVIFNRSSIVLAGIGQSILVSPGDEPLVFECHLMRARVKTQEISPEYLCRYSLSPHGRRYFLSRAQTTTMTTINQGDLESLPLPLPSIDCQRDITVRLDDLDNAIGAAKKRIEETKSLLSFNVEWGLGYVQ
jgi:type I restriction enzyme S subunit